MRKKYLIMMIGIYGMVVNHSLRRMVFFPLTLTKGMMNINIRKPSKFELNTCKVIKIIKDKIWNPRLYSEDPINGNDYRQIVSEF